MYKKYVIKSYYFAVFASNYILGINMSDAIQDNILLLGFLLLITFLKILMNIVLQEPTKVFL